MDDPAPTLSRRACLRVIAAGIAATSLPSVGIAAEPVAIESDRPLTNEDVLTLSRLNLGDDVVIAKIRQARRVAFRLEVSDLSALRDRGLSGPVLVAMLERARQVGDSAPPVREGRVVLRGRDGFHELVGVQGDVERRHAVVAILSSLNLAGENAAARTTDARPNLLLPTAFRPDGEWFLVRARIDSEGHRRRFQARTATILSGRQAFLPHDDAIVPYLHEEVEIGLQRLWPAADLDSGEYALWRVRAGGASEAPAWLYDFGVDDVAGRSWGQERR